MLIEVTGIAIANIWKLYYSSMVILQWNHILIPEYPRRGSKAMSIKRRNKEEERAKVSVNNAQWSSMSSCFKNYYFKLEYFINLNFCRCCHQLYTSAFSNQSLFILTIILIVNPFISQNNMITCPTEMAYSAMVSTNAWTKN